MIVGTEKVLWEAGGSVKQTGGNWSPWGALGRRPCAVQEPEDHKRITANGEVQTKEEATVLSQRIGFNRDSEAPRRHAGSSLTCKTLRRSRIFPRVDQWSIPYHILKGRRIQCNTENYVPIVVPGFSTRSSSSTTSTSTISLQQDVVDPTLRPALTRSHSTSSRELGDRFRESTKIKKHK